MAKLLDGTRVYGSFTANTAVIAGTLNVAPAIAASFDKANSANLLAYNTGIGANAYADAVGTAGNNYTRTVGTAGNNYTNTVGTAGNNYTNAVGAAGNNYTNTVGTAGNNYTNAVGAASNAYTNAVGAASNAYASTVGTSANLYADTIGTASNAYAVTVGTAGNNYTNAVGAASNAYTNAVGAASNNYANVVFVKLNALTQTITGDLTITGNLSVSGNAVVYSANNLIINDPLIILANNNVDDVIDIGFIGHYRNSSGYDVHTGLYREHSDKSYYLFNEYTQEPGIVNHIGTFSNNMTLAVLNADLKTSNLVLGGINAISWITASFDKANSANLLAYNTGIGANAYTNTVGTAGNNYTNTVGTAGNNYALSIGTAGNNYTNTKVSSVSGTAGQIYSSGGTTPTLNLISSGVTATTYGSASIVPIITVDQFGRITSASNVAVASSPGGGTSVSANLDSVSATRFPVFIDSVTGTLTRANVSYGLTYNPSSNTLTTKSVIATDNVSVYNYFKFANTNQELVHTYYNVSTQSVDTVFI